MPTKPDQRNRSAEALARGGKLIGVSLTSNGLALLNVLQAHLTASLGRCSQTQTIEFALREARKKLPK